MGRISGYRGNVAAVPFRRVPNLQLNVARSSSGTRRKSKVSTRTPAGKSCADADGSGHSQPSGIVGQNGHVATARVFGRARFDQDAASRGFGRSTGQRERADASRRVRRYPEKESCDKGRTTHPPDMDTSPPVSVRALRPWPPPAIISMEPPSPPSPLSLLVPCPANSMTFPPVDLAEVASPAFS